MPLLDAYNEIGKVHLLWEVSRHERLTRTSLCGFHHNMAFYYLDHSDKGKK